MAQDREGVTVDRNRTYFTQGKKPATPEEIQAACEYRWRERSKPGKENSDATNGCPWCDWAWSAKCGSCPLALTIGFTHCDTFPPYLDWAQDPTAENAAALSALLVEHREAIIREAYEIMKEMR